MIELYGFFCLAYPDQTLIDRNRKTSCNWILMLTESSVPSVPNYVAASSSSVSLQVFRATARAGVTVWVLSYATTYKQFAANYFMTKFR